MKKPWGFDDRLTWATPWVEQLKRKLNQFLIKHNIRTVNYDNREDIELQQSGVDFIVTSEKGDWEAKIRRYDYYKYGDILLEITSVKEANKLGWVYTSIADALAYCWLNESKTNLMRRGYIILLKRLRETAWFKKLTEIYQIKETKSKRHGQTWTTEFVCVPIQDFPRGTLYPFDPSVTRDNKQKQTKLKGDE